MLLDALLVDLSVRLTAFPRFLRLSFGDYSFLHRTWEIFSKLFKQGNKIAPLDGNPKPDPFGVVLCTVFVGSLKRAPPGSHVSSWEF